MPHGFDREAHLLPRLLHLAALADTQRQRLLAEDSEACAHGELPLLSFLIASGAAPLRLRHHLAAQLLLPVPGGRMLLRYYCPRVLTQLRWMLDARQLVRLFGPIERCTFRLDGRWETLLAPSGPEGAPETAPTTSLDRLGRIGAINEVLAGLEPTPDLVRHETVSRTVDALLDRARHEYGFAEEAEQVAFADHGMRVHPRFDRHPAIRNLIDRLAHDECSFRDAAAMLDADDWRRIATEIDQPLDSSPSQ